MLTQHREPRELGRLLSAVSLSAAGMWIVVIALVTGCPETVPGTGDPDPNAPAGSDTARNCVGCHTNETLLKAVAKEEEPPAADTGEG